MRGYYKSATQSIIKANGIIRARLPKKRDIWTIRFLIACGIFCMIVFLFWFLKPSHIGYSLIYWPLTFALLFKLFMMLHEWYHYWNLSVPEKPEWKTKFTVDVFTTFCKGEPEDMILRTLKAMVAIKYPHTNYLCDEADDPYLKKVCAELGVIHVTRIKKINAKAGNINNALKNATGEICVILDPDHVPVPGFLESVLPYFEDEKIGYVQCVQAYGNQSESFIARAAAEQSYSFYGPLMMCMNTYGTVQAIGANCSFRRSALDSIGGHAPGLAEDMNTAMQLQAKGWKALYVPEILTRGLVPSTPSAYFKQQLKWARGCFELLFRTYPGLFKNLTWRQRFHHFAMPIFFLFGLINFIDILIPLMSLTFAQVPWEMDLGYFALMFLPLCGLGLIIRLFAQRWLLEEQERGFHVAGGILRMGTWWIYLVGFIYSIFNINVPYIPTPKEDSQENNWRLNIPSIIVVALSVPIIIYGLSIDWTPYSIAMAFYAVINIAILGYVVFMSQQKFLSLAQNTIKKIPVLKYIYSPLEFIGSRTQKNLYALFRHGRLSIVLAIALLLVSYNSIENETSTSTVTAEKEFGGFYTGISFFKNDPGFKTMSAMEKFLGRHFDIISIKHSWNDTVESLPENAMKEISENNAIPLLNWGSDDPDKEKIYPFISKGYYDSYLKKCAAILRKYREPVFINFYPGFDVAGKTSSAKTPEEFILAWQYVYTFFNNLGISNITWVWSPEYASSKSYYPGPKFVDWIGVSCLNYGKNTKDKDWHSFSEIYTPYRNGLGAFQKPFMITEFGAVAGTDQSFWMASAFKNIQGNFKEVKSVVIKNSPEKFIFRDAKTNDTTIYIADFNLQGSTFKTIAVCFKEVPFNKKPLFENNYAELLPAPEKYHSDFITGKPGKFQLKIKGHPYYIRGVAFNTAQDWRDGNMPLTRRRVVKDFERIRAMGANTIRRYDDGIYDRNVLNIANEYDLKVLYGFWFDPKVDYYKDTSKVKEYMENVEEKVRQYKDHPAILAWSLGNETWGLLKHRYSKPYLTKVRNQYVKFIELLAERIHEIDPSHPVFSCMEHEIYQLPGELVAFHDGAPSLDALGVNSYYKEQISTLNHVTYQFDSLRPYIVSEFGPRGYWDPSYNRTLKGSLVEDSETEKANWYTEQWSNYVEAYKGFDIGGFAYCWHDRMEGSMTWFGLTDYQGRAKPSYYALKKLWTKQSDEVLPDFSIATSGKIIPGEECEFKATSSSKKKEFVYEWYLYKNDYLEIINNIEYSGDGSVVDIKIPKKAANYRLYLYVSDAKGNVTTTSYAIKIK